MKSEGNIEKFKQAAPRTSSMESLELKVNLNEEQKDYLEKLKAKKDKILRGKTPDQLAKERDLETLKRYNAVLDEILEFLKTKKLHSFGVEIKRNLQSAILRFQNRGKIEDGYNLDTEKGEVTIDFQELAHYWQGFYDQLGMDLPIKPIELSLEEKEIFSDLLSNGYDKIMVIPRGLNFEALKEKLGTEVIISSSVPENAQEYEILQRDLTRQYLILTKDYDFERDCGKDAISEDIADKDEKKIWNMPNARLFAFMNKSSLTGLKPMEYLILQQEYFLRTNKNLDGDLFEWHFGSILPDNKVMSTMKHNNRFMLALKEPADDIASKMGVTRFCKVFSQEVISN